MRLSPQALRLGTFLNETKPLKILHGSESAESAVPLVLRLGNYLNGGKGPMRPRS